MGRNIGLTWWRSSSPNSTSADISSFPFLSGALNFLRDGRGRRKTVGVRSTVFFFFFWYIRTRIHTIVNDEGMHPRVKTWLDCSTPGPCRPVRSAVAPRVDSGTFKGDASGPGHILRMTTGY